ncbi:hypothetical protein Tco_1257913 [Tanacetum coccineum]
MCGSCMRDVYHLKCIPVGSFKNAIMQAARALTQARTNAGEKRLCRFVTVTRTQHTGIPSLTDIGHPEKLLGMDDDEGDDMRAGNKASFALLGMDDDEGDDMRAGKTPSNRTKKVGLRSVDSKSAKNKTSGKSSKNKRRDKDKMGLYAA